MAKTKNVPKKEESPKVNQYKTIFKDIDKFVEKYNFHATITEMMYQAIFGKCDNPFKAMGEYLFKKGNVNIKHYANEEVQQAIKEKDETIQKLNARIEFLEKTQNTEKIEAQNIEKKEPTAMDTTPQKNIEMAPTLSDLSLSGIENFTQISKVLNLPIQMRDDHQMEEIKYQYPDFPMTSDSDVTLVPIDEKPKDVLLSGTISTIEILSSEEQIGGQDCQSEAEIIHKDVEILDNKEGTNEPECSGTSSTSMETTLSPEKDKPQPVDSFDDFEPDYEPDE